MGGRQCRRPCNSSRDTSREIATQLTLAAGLRAASVPIRTSSNLVEIASCATAFQLFSEIRAQEGQGGHSPFAGSGHRRLSRRACKTSRGKKQHRRAGRRCCDPSRLRRPCGSGGLVGITAAWAPATQWAQQAYRLSRPWSLRRVGRCHVRLLPRLLASTKLWRMLRYPTAPSAAPKARPTGSVAVSPLAFSQGLASRRSVLWHILIPVLCSARTKLGIGCFCARVSVVSALPLGAGPRRCPSLFAQCVSEIVGPISRSPQCRQTHGGGARHRPRQFGRHDGP